MKKLILYYSWSGTCRKHAESRTDKEGADLIEVRDIRKPGALKAYTAGCLNAMKMKPGAIEPIDANLESYDAIAVVGPVWAGHPAPAVTAALNMLPAGKDVVVAMISGSGKSGAREKVQSLVESRGSTLTKYQDIKADQVS